VDELMIERATAHPSTPKSPIRHAWLVALLLAGCGGKQANPMQVEETAADNEPAAHPRSGQVPPEKMDEINRDLERKRAVISRCIAQAVDNKELPKNSSGKVTIELVIAPGGKADSVKVVRATLQSKTLHECVINHVKDIQFPDLPKPYETSYTYGFEAM
jgi:hypothetical protein